MNAYNSERNEIIEKTNTPLERYITNSNEKELLAVEIDIGRSAILIPKLKA